VKPEAPGDGDGVHAQVVDLHSRRWSSFNTEQKLDSIDNRVGLLLEFERARQAPSAPPAPPTPQPRANPDALRDWALRAEALDSCSKGHATGSAAPWAGAVAAVAGGLICAALFSGRTEKASKKKKKRNLQRLEERQKQRNEKAHKARLDTELKRAAETAAAATAREELEKLANAGQLGVTQIIEKTINVPVPGPEGDRGPRGYKGDKGDDGNDGRDGSIQTVVMATKLEKRKGIW